MGWLLVFWDVGFVGGSEVVIRGGHGGCCGDSFGIEDLFCFLSLHRMSGIARGCLKEKESWDLNTQEKIEAAGKKKEGNGLFKSGKHERASKRYEKAIKYIEYDTSFGDEEKQKAKALKITCNLNNAAWKLKLKDYKQISDFRF